MKPAPFVYLRPASVEDLIEMVQATEDSGKILAGGQSLLPLLNMRLARPGHLIDANFVPGLSEIDVTDGSLRVGAMVRQRDLELFPAVIRHTPLVSEALGHVAHVQIRHRGTIGGNLAHADPASELPAVMVALDATLVVRGPSGERRIAARDFYVSTFTTAMAWDEVLTHVEVPKADPRSGWAFEEYARRAGDFGLAGVAAQVSIRGHRFTEVRLGLAGVSSVPVRCSEAEGHLVGASIEDPTSTIDEAVRSATADLSPTPDLEADTRYRIALVSELMRRALTRALGRARARE